MAEQDPYAQFDDVPAAPDPYAQFHPDEQASPAWYEHLLAGVQHRGGSIVRQGMRALEHPLETSMMLSPPAMMLRSTLDAFGARTPVGEGEAAAAAAQKARDAGDVAAGRGEGFGGSLLYGAGESPELMLAPGLGVEGKAGKILEGAAQGLYSANANDRSLTEGALGGAVGGGVGAALGHIGGKVVNAMRGRWADPEAQAVDALARANGVNLSVGDLAPGGQFAWAENKARWLPGSGVPETRRGQAQGIADWTTRLEDEVGAPIRTQLGSMAPEEIVAKSARDREQQARATVRGLFAQVPGDVEVPTTEFAPSVQSLFKEYPNIFGESATLAPESVKARIGSIVNPKTMKPTPEDLQLLAGAFGGPERMSARQWQQAEQHSPGIMARMGGAPVEPEPLSAMDAHWISSHLGDISRTLDENGAGRHAMTMVDDARQALLRDMDNVDEANVGPAFANARAAFKRDVVPFMEDPTLRSLVKPNSRGELLFSKLGNDRFATADTLMQNLTPEGIAALQYGQLTKATGKGVSQTLKSGVSTQALSRGLNLGTEMGDQRASARIFSPGQQQSIGDLVDVVRHAPGAATWAHEPPTGVQNQWLNMLKAGALLAAGSGHMGTVLAATAPFALARGMNVASNNPAFKRFAMAEGKNQVSPYIQALLAASMSGEATPQYPSPDLLSALGQQ